MKNDSGYAIKLDLLHTGWRQWARRLHGSHRRAQNTNRPFWHHDKFIQCLFYAFFLFVFLFILVLFCFSGRLLIDSPLHFVHRHSNSKWLSRTPRKRSRYSACVQVACIQTYIDIPDSLTDWLSNTEQMTFKISRRLKIRPSFYQWMNAITWWLINEEWNVIFISKGDIVSTHSMY